MFQFVYVSPLVFNIQLTKLQYALYPSDDLVKIIEQHRENSKINLKAVPIIVAGGYGLGTKENFSLVKELAHTIGGEPGVGAQVEFHPENKVGLIIFSNKRKSSIYFGNKIHAMIRRIASIYR